MGFPVGKCIFLQECALPAEKCAFLQKDTVFWGAQGRRGCKAQKSRVLPNFQKNIRLFILQNDVGPRNILFEF